MVNFDHRVDARLQELASHAVENRPDTFVIEAFRSPSNETCSNILQTNEAGNGHARTAQNERAA